MQQGRTIGRAEFAAMSSSEEGRKRKRVGAMATTSKAKAGKKETYVGHDRSN